MKLIYKDSVVAEIEKMRDKAYPNSEWNHGYVAACEKILSLLNALEVKEVDLYEELNNFIMSYRNKETGYSLDTLAEHFYELGLKAQKGE